MAGKYLILFVSVMVMLPACKRKPYTDPPSSPISEIVKDIAKTNVLMGSAVGIAGNRSEQWDRYEVLRSKATDDELLSLTNDTNTVVRCYAFQALAEKNYVDVSPVVIRHLSDTATVHTLFGCLGGSEKVGDFMLRKVYSKCGNDYNYHLSLAHRATVDSLLLYGSDNRLDTRDMVISRIDPLKRYYVRIRQLAITEKNKAAVVALSKYKKQQDIPLIKELFNDPNSQELGFAAVTNFPDRSFYPFLERALKDEIKNNKGNEMFIQRIYHAIIQYKDEQSKELLRSVLSDANEMQYKYHSNCLSQILRECPTAIYEGLVDSVYIGRSLRH